MRFSRTVRLIASDFWVDVRLAHFDGRWLASADTPDGPSLGLGRLPLEALTRALDPFDGAADELLQSVPENLYYWS
jgi:hypothetical protein